MKKLLFTLLGLFLTVIRVSALDFTVGDFSYTTLEDNKVAVTGWSLPSNSDVVIPATVTYENVDYIVAVIGSVGSGTLKSLYISETIEDIGDGFFYNNKINKFTIHPDNKFFKVVDGNLYSKDGTVFVACPKSIKNLIIADGVKEIAEDAVSKCSYLESVVLPKSLEIIYWYAFAYDSKIKEVKLPDNLKEIKYEAFIGCEGLEMVIIPMSVKNVSNGAFNDMANSKVVFLNPETNISVDGDDVKGPIFYAKGNTYSTLKETLQESTVLSLPEKVFSLDPPPVYLTANSWTGISTIMNIQPACGFQADMTFPEGLSMIDVKIAGDFSADSVKISYSQLENGDYRLIGYTVDGSMMPDDITVIFYVRSDENFKRSKILIHDAVLSIYDNEYKCEDQEWRMAGYVIRPFMPETMEEGETHTLPNPIEGAPDNVTYRFVSSNTNIITVDGNTLTAQAPGNVRVIIDVEDEGINTLLGYDIEVLAALWGDADGSEAIDVADIVAMVNHILGRSSENFNSRLADIDRNGRINIADLTALIRIILTQPQAESVAVNSRAMADNVNREVSFGEAEDLGGDYLRVPVELDVTADYSAMQGEIVIPEGMSLEKMQLAGELGKHTLDYAMVGDNRARFVIYSISLASLPADRKSAVASVTLHGRTTSDDVLCLNDAIVCDNDCVTYSLGSATMTFEGMSGLDALRASGFGVRAVRSGMELTAPAETSARITDLSGRTVADVTAPTSVTLPAGLYIVSFADGPVMKVVVK